jgi:hypothetical protein
MSGRRGSVSVQITDALGPHPLAGEELARLLNELPPFGWRLRARVDEAMVGARAGAVVMGLVQQAVQDER